MKKQSFKKLMIKKCTENEPNIDQKIAIASCTNGVVLSLYSALK